MPATTPHPLTGKLVTLFGGGGFLGRHAAQALMLAGARVRIVQRDPKRAFAVKALGNLGQVQFVAADASDPAAAERAATGSDAVVNLVGVLKGDFERMHVATAANIAHAATAAGAAMVQISAIGADAASASAYGRSKAHGEAAIKLLGTKATILRPSVVFGREDGFINRFAGMIRMAPVVPVVAPQTLFQPVFVGDVAAAIVAVLADPAAHGGKTYELGGPERVSMRGLIEWIGRKAGRSPILIDVPDFAAAALASATGWLPGAPITKDQWAMLGRDNIVETGANTLADLGVAPTPLDAVAEDWLDIYRKHGRFTGKSSDARSAGGAATA